MQVQERDLVLGCALSEMIHDVNKEKLTSAWVSNTKAGAITKAAEVKSVVQTPCGISPGRLLPLTIFLRVRQWVRPTSGY